jgi:hypothetical protein
MASLTEASILTRKIIRYGLYLLIIVIVGRFLWWAGTSLYARLNPPEPPKPTAAFGKLPKLPFPEDPSKKLENVTYTLQTTDGALPTFPELVAIYQMPEPQSNLQGLEAAKQKAQSLGFSQDGKLSIDKVPNIYRFDKIGKPSHLTMNIITGVFSISYDVASDPTVLGQQPPAPSQAVSQAQGYLTRAGSDAEDLVGPTTTEFLRAEKGNFVQASSLSEADVTKINIFRKNYGPKEEYPAVTANMPEANVWLMLSGRTNEVLAAEFHYFPVDSTKSGTYSIKTAQQAWDQLKEGKGYIANPGQRSTTEVIVRKVYLGYYDAGQYTPYYQPVVVFEGDGGFFGYVPAVVDDFYGEAEE